LVGCSIDRRRGKPHPDHVSHDASDLVTGRPGLNPNAQRHSACCRGDWQRAAHHVSGGIGWLIADR
jgi:hypothetical protein